MKTRNLLFLLAPWLIVFIVAVLIYYLSSQNREASHEMSQGIARIAFDVLRPSFSFIRENSDRLLLDAIDTFVRKLAHIFLYYMITIFVMLGFRRLTDEKIIIFFGSLLAVLFLACADEFLQLFSYGRGASAFDVLLDMAGAVAALLTALLAIAVRRVKFRK